MPRLNNRAYQVLRTEIQKCAGDGPLSQIEQNLVLEELEKLRSQPGSPAALKELRKLVIGAYPKFSEKTISRIQEIINQLEKVHKGTTAYLKAQELLLSAKNKLKQLQPR